MDKINPPKFYLVRNMCDKFETEAQMKDCKRKDQEVLE